MVIISFVYPSSHNKQFVPQLSERSWMSFFWALLLHHAPQYFSAITLEPPSRPCLLNTLSDPTVSQGMLSPGTWLPPPCPGCSSTFLGEHLLWRVMGGRWTLLRSCSHTPRAGDCAGSSHLRPWAQHGANSFCSKGWAHGFIVHVNLKELCNLLKWAFLFSRMLTVKQSTIQNRCGDLKCIAPWMLSVWHTIHTPCILALTLLVFMVSFLHHPWNRLRSCVCTVYHPVPRPAPRRSPSLALIAQIPQMQEGKSLHWKQTAAPLVCGLGLHGIWHSVSSKYYTHILSKFIFKYFSSKVKMFIPCSNETKNCYWYKCYLKYY